MMADLRDKMRDTITFSDGGYQGEKPDVMTLAQGRERVVQEQVTKFFVPMVKDLNQGQKFEMYCYDRRVSAVNPRYTLVVIDSSSKDILKKRSCGAFITP